MRLYYHKCQKPNFGDEINTWFWEKLFNLDFDSSTDSTFAGIGTILNDKLPTTGTIHVFGSGAGYGTSVPTSPPENWKIHCVRGPLTAKILNLPESLAVSDPAILLPNLFPINQQNKKFKVSFLPHIGIDSPQYQSFIQSLDINYICPSSNDKKVIEQIANSEYLITSAMHGSIIADTYRVPWFPIVTSKEILDFKWRDWCQSIKLPYKPIALPAYWSNDKQTFLDNSKRKVKSKIIEYKLKKLITTEPHFLSQQQILSSRQDKLLEIAASFKKEYLNK